MLNRSDTLLDELAKQSSATVHEAMGRRGALPSAIKPVAATMRVCGPAFTVDSPPMDNLLLHQAIYAAAPGDVLVVRAGDHYEAGYWGDIMSVAAQARGLAGLVIDGGVRDSRELAEMNFATFSRGLCIKGTTKHGGGALNRPVAIGSVVVSPGDIVLGDADGVVVIPKAEAQATLEAAIRRVTHEDEVKRQLRAGKSTLEIYGLKS
ncbi:MAG TPA: 4-carboxy-4-hydroxy-2-oxoadipate aldolase/oxaloacetate decarboxylase [Alphaproteobacteria bacterium]|nr:4-carboxy-4-hydroxy-2-oxoadipate aldolase/oxaloacetate decarboxylase [Alphaproteobacteria bacterium]